MVSSSCLKSLSQPLMRSVLITGDDGQLLLYDLTGPLPTPRSDSKSQNTISSPHHALSPPITPNTSHTPPPPKAVDIWPTRAYTAESEIVNLAFRDQEDQIGFVSGSKLTIIDVW